jgi:Replication-relaxation
MRADSNVCRTVTTGRGDIKECHPNENSPLVNDDTTVKGIRRPRFRRASEPPDFRITNDDVLILWNITHHRFLRSTHIAALVGRSLDRTNDRLCRLFHAGYVNRPRAQLDYYPTAGSSPMVYALADRGATLLSERGTATSAKVGWNRKNGEAGRPFIDHQLEIMDFYVSLQCAVRKRTDVQVMHASEIASTLPAMVAAARNPFGLNVSVAHQGAIHEIGLVPDLVFGLKFTDGSRRCFMVEIDRGTMPVERSDITETSFERKMRVYLTAHAGKQHERQFGWKTFRVLTVTTEDHRKRSIIEALRKLRIPNSPGPSLFLFATRDELRMCDPLAHRWLDGNGAGVQLIHSI